LLRFFGGVVGMEMALGFGLDWKDGHIAYKSKRFLRAFWLGIS
jgi:hypothetical protein